MYTYKRAGSFYFEYEFQRARFRGGGFPTKTLAKLAGEEDRRRHREQRVARLWNVRDPRRPRSAPSLAEYVEKVYRVHHLPRLEPSTQKTARSQLGKLVAHLGRVKLDALEPAVVDEYTTGRLKLVSPAQVREEIARLSRVLNHAIAREVIRTHPFKGWRRPQIPRRDYRVVTPAEEAKLLRPRPHHFEDWIALALDTGLRKGELRVLERGWISGSELRILQPKVKRVKVIPLTPRAAAIIRRRMTGGHTVLLGGPDGKGYSLAWIDRQWARALGAAGLSGIRFQDLRHTFASRCLEATGDLAAVGEILGHKPPYTMTLRYLHVLPEGKRRAIESLWRRFGSTPRKSPPRRRAESRITA